MRTRFYIKNHTKQLAEQMWGKVLRRSILCEGVFLYICEDYTGIIICDKSYSMNRQLKKIFPWEYVVYEVSDKNGKAYYLESEKISIEKENIDEFHFYVFEEDSLSILYYYDRKILDYFYELEISEKKDEQCKKYLREERKKIFNNMVMNYPEFIKKTDQKKAIKKLDKIYNQYIRFESQINSLDKRQIKILKEQFGQKKELLKKRG